MTLSWQIMHCIVAVKISGKISCGASLSLRIGNAKKARLSKCFTSIVRLQSLAALSIALALGDEAIEEFAQNLYPRFQFMIIGAS